MSSILRAFLVVVLFVVSAALIYLARRDWRRAQGSTY